MTSHGCHHRDPWRGLLRARLGLSARVVQTLFFFWSALGWPLQGGRYVLFEIKHTHNSFGLAVLHTHNNFKLLLVLEHRAARGAGSSPAASPSWSACSAAPWISGSHRMPAKRFSSRLTRWLGRTGTSFRWLTRRRMGRTEVKEEVHSRRSLAEIGLRNLASRILLGSLPADAG